jgi:hypothetical protein
MKDFNDIIKTLLGQNPELRDNDLKLIANIWWMKINQIKHRYDDLELQTIHGFIKLYSEGKIPNDQTIRRERRKIQEHDKSLRGKLWNKRHNKATEVSHDMVQRTMFGD